MSTPNHDPHGLAADLRRFEPEGHCAILPRALAVKWAARAPVQRDATGYPMPYSMLGDVAVVSAEGPLMQRGGGYYFDGHDAIAERVKAALAEPKARAVVLKLNSPGGIAAGCFAAAGAIRSAARAAGKPLVAFADEMACSAAYALACACDAIYLPPTGEVGSVGVLSAVLSLRRAYELEGIDVQLVRSAPMKALGHPIDPLSDAAVAREQQDVDELARQFYALVAEARRMTPEAVAALQGDTRMGAAAVAAGLADAVCTFEEGVARAASAPPSRPSPATSAGTNTPKRTTMEKFASAVLALAGTTDEDAALGKLAAWKDGAARAATLEQELATLRAGQAAADREAVIAGAVAARKITPAQAASAREGKGFLASLTTEQLRAYVAEAVPVVASEGEGPRQPAQLPAPGATKEVTLTDEEKRQAPKMGLTEEQMLATKKAHLGVA